MKQTIDLLAEGWTSVGLGREYYSIQNEIYEWCCNNINNDPGGGYERGWTVVFMFGYSNWLFKHKEDAMMFKLYWEGMKHGS